MTGRAYFITAAGTDLGKTHVAAALARALVLRGRRVRALKPVLSGYREDQAATSDAGVLLAACGAAADRESVESIAPWRFAAPLSPDRAAALEGRRIDVDALLAWCGAEIARNEGILLIEGIGGVMVPLDESRTVRDWIAALGVPTLLVGGSYLGAVSHTLSALAALRAVDVEPAAIVVSESADATVSLADGIASLAAHTGGVPLFVLPRAGDAAAVERIADCLLAEGP